MGEGLQSSGYLALLLVCIYVAIMAVVCYRVILQKKRHVLTSAIVYHLLIFGGLFMILPFYWMVITAFKSLQEAIAFPPSWIPLHWRWQNFIDAWNAPPGDLTFGRYFYVSIVTAVASTGGTLATSALAAYAFAKMRFIGKGLFFYLVLAMMMVPGQVLLIPNYILLQALNWINTYQALIVPWLASVFCIFLMRQFFMTIPDDLWDAAQIDGSGRFRYLIMVILPLSRPVLITSGIFTFLGSWNSLLWPLIVTNSANMRTLMVGLQTFTEEAGSKYHLLMAASTFAIVPVILLFFFLQRFFIQGIARTGLKD
jgi:multiple sugar transport system permease protein